MRQTAAAGRVCRENNSTFTAHKDFRANSVSPGWRGLKQRLKAVLFMLSGVVFLYYYTSFVAFHELSTSSSSNNSPLLRNIAPISSLTAVGVRHSAELTAAAEVVAAAWTELAVAARTHPKIFEKPVQTHSADPTRFMQAEPQRVAAAIPALSFRLAEPETLDEPSSIVRAQPIATSAPVETVTMNQPINIANSPQEGFAKDASSDVALAAESTISRTSFVNSSNVAAHGIYPGTPPAQWDKATQDWADRVTAKASCLRARRTSSTKSGVAFFLYHMRKAAGTTVRSFLENQCRSFSHRRGRRLTRAPAGVEGCLFESEGLSLPPDTLHALEGGASTAATNNNNAGIRGGDPSRNGPLVVTVTTLRNPVDRALSLYWYEHVGWWDGVKHELDKLKPLDQWLATWRDGSAWKQKFGLANPGSTYVEPCNYFVKSLGGWKGPGPATRQHLAAAQRALEQFDVVLLTERMQVKSSQDNGSSGATARHFAPLKFLLEADFHSGSSSGKNSQAGHELKADDEPKKRLSARLLGSFGSASSSSSSSSSVTERDAAVRAQLAAENALDLELWAFAEKLVDQRSSWAKAALVAQQEHSNKALSGSGSGEPSDDHRCPLGSGSAGKNLFKGKIAGLLGIHRPPGHKQ